MKVKAVQDGEYINLINIETDEIISRVYGKPGCVRLKMHLKPSDKDGFVYLHNPCHKSGCCNEFVL